MKPKYKTLRVSKQDKDFYGLSRFGNAGPYPNITGMKERYWGLDALCVKCGAYVYRVDEETYKKCGGVI